MGVDGKLEEEGGGGGNQNICVSDHMYNSDSFVVDVERFSHLIHKKDINGNSAITLQRNVSRKGCFKSGNNNIKPTTLPAAAPPLHGPVKAIVMTLGSPKFHHHQILVKKGTPAASENKQFGPPSIDPRRILMFLATLSSLGTILLIYFTLSIGKLNHDNYDPT
ncbi:hypothetical protein ACS0TY_018171 [Phlomoides rotata]